MSVDGLSFTRQGVLGLIMLVLVCGDFLDLTAVRPSRCKSAVNQHLRF